MAPEPSKSKFFLWYFFSIKFLLDVFNIILTIFFVIETILKLAVHQKKFFYSGWRIFNFTITVLTVFLMFLGIGIDLKDGPQKSFLVFLRLLRMITLLNKIPVLNGVLKAFIYTIPGIMSTAGIMIVVEFIFSMFGVFLLCNVKFQTDLSINANFINFWSSFPTMIRVASGEYWNGIMHDIVRPYSQYFQCNENPTYYDYVNNGYSPVGCGWPYAPIFFILFQLIFSFVFLNLFIVVVVGNILEINSLANSMLNDNEMKKFQKAWGKYDPEVISLISINRELDLSCMEM